MEHSENVCPVCSEHIDIYAVGACDHPICFRCSARMRVLCEQMYCPICRTDLPKVFLIQSSSKFHSINSRGWHSYRKSNTFFEDKIIKGKFFELLDHKCSICKDRPPDRYMEDLSKHMRREHQRFYCALCVEHLKIFPYERKHYDRSGLATHRREGDPDDSSYKGHPLCKFCDERYLDNDELSRHLRKDHFYCHFCDTDGSNQFYSEYPVLMEHFREEHYLCEEGECVSARFTHAFRSEIDLKAHKANCHSKGMKRSATKQARTLDVEFALAPRNRPERSYRDYDGSGRGGRGYRNSRNKYDNRQEQDDPELAKAMEASLTEAREKQRRDRRERRELPSRPQRPGETVTKDPTETQQPLKRDKESFPTLSGKSSPVSEVKPTEAEERSVTPPVSSNSLAQKLALSEHHTVRNTTNGVEDFPALSKSSNANSAQWVKGRSGLSNRDQDFPALSNSARPTKSAVNSVKKPMNVNVGPRPSSAQKPANFQTKKAVNENEWEDFPGLPSKTVKNKKAAASGPWVSKPAKNQTPEAPKNKKETEAMSNDDSFAFTLADLGKSLHDDTTKVVNGSVNHATSSNVSASVDKKSGGSEKKNKNKKKKKGKSEESLDDFVGYPVLEPTKTKEDVAPVGRKSPAVQEEELNKENSIRDLKPNLTSSVVRSSDEPWTVVQSGKKPWTMVDSLEDFPNLANSNPVINSNPKPPPGFPSQSPPHSNPPPGFSNALSPPRPPPGLAKPALSQINDIPHEDINRDLTNMQHVYFKPHRFAERNKNLISEIRFFLCNDEDKFDLFKCWSGEFRQGTITAGKYYNRCLELFGKDRLSQIFPELLVLLPDINKQQELLGVYTSSANKVKKDGWTTLNNNFLTCPVCQQVFISADQEEHLSHHNLDSDFPTLSQSNNTFGLRAWVRAK